MSKEKMLRVRLSDEDFARLEAYAKSKDWAMSQVVREYIKRLPKPTA
jgi:predicted DNA-binding protein